MAPRKAACEAVARVERMRRFAIALVALLLAGCGTKQLNHDVAGFTKAGRTPAERSILRTIATYRTTRDTARACALITDHFLKTTRFDGKVRNCRQVIRSAGRFLPDSASVQSVSGAGARVLVDEPTATKSIYEMRREGATWKIDDIVEAR
jgi:hypothetical protein